MPRLCDSAPENAKIIVWDNWSSDETIRLIKKFEKHSRVELLVYKISNDLLRGPTNWFWQNFVDASLVSKVDNGCLVAEDWCETLQQTHIDIPETGVLGCWRFLPEDFNEQIAEKKIHRFGTHRILRNCWVEGSGYLMKRAVLEKL